MEKFVELRAAVDSVELVDAHAHNLVQIDSDFPFIKCFSEADGDALTLAPHTLSFKRSLRDIAELYGSEATIDGIQSYRTRQGLQSISSKCFKAAKVSTLLIDDGLELDKKHDLKWHNNLVPFVGRILRIERLAEKILDEGIHDKWTLDKFTETFLSQLKLVSNEIVGLKSIAAYRGGLQINPSVNRQEAEDDLDDILHAGSPVRIAKKSFVDYLFVLSLEFAVSFNLPMQIHTGFGDTDLDLSLSNPLHLYPLLKDARFANCRIVLLHASYPFSREASYLASVFPQIYLDFGLAIPKLSVHGMISSLKELLELAPLKKIMFSTDGYAFPETYYLGAKRAREVVFSVLRDTCMDGDLSVPEAIEAVQDIFAENAIRLYKLHKPVKSCHSNSVISCNPPGWGIETPQQAVIKLVRILWVDASGQQRCRVVPEKRFDDVVKANGVGLTVACMAMTSMVDCPADETNLSGVGEIRLMPDLSTRKAIPWIKEQEMVIGDMHLVPGEPWEYCPRETLRKVSKILKDEFNLEMIAGFENEFYMLRNVKGGGKDEWVPFDAAPYCSTSSFDAASPILHEVLTVLQTLNIPVEQIHAEAGKGQFELALGYTDCTKAADYVIYTRETIRSIARKHGLLATFVPKYTLDDIGSGSHVHLSLWENGKNVFKASDKQSKHGMSKIGEEFMAGVLHHLPSILAFTAPVPNSYDRLQPNTWSGAYQCWGKENRESPIRTACPPGIDHGFVSNFELKCFDGCANPHLGLASILAAGIDGLRNHLLLPEPIDDNPYNLGGKVKRLPESLAESFEALKKDAVMEDFIGSKLMVAIKGIRKAEIAYYSQNSEAYKQLIHKY